MKITTTSIEFDTKKQLYALLKLVPTEQLRPTLAYVWHDAEVCTILVTDGHRLALFGPRDLWRKFSHKRAVWVPRALLAKTTVVRREPTKAWVEPGTPINCRCWTPDAIAEHPCPPVFDVYANELRPDPQPGQTGWLGLQTQYLAQVAAFGDVTGAADVRIRMGTTSSSPLRVESDADDCYGVMLIAPFAARGRFEER